MTRPRGELTTYRARGGHQSSLEIMIVLYRIGIEETRAHRHKTIWAWECTQMKNVGSWFYRNNFYIF